MKLRPLDDRVVLEQLEAEEKTAGGIFLPEAAKEKPQIGKVIAAGPGKQLDNGRLSKVSVKKKDKVLYSKYAGNDVEVEGKKLIIIHESDILGIVEK